MGKASKRRHLLRETAPIRNQWANIIVDLLDKAKELDNQRSLTIDDESGVIYEYGQILARNSNPENQKGYMEEVTVLCSVYGFNNTKKALKMMPSFAVWLDRFDASFDKERRKRNKRQVA